jgi:hypothetical protein
LLVAVDGVEMIVDPGTGSYTADPGLRNRLRCQAVHSCLCSGVEPSRWKEGVPGLFYLRDVWRGSSRVLDDGDLVMAWSFEGRRAQRTVCVRDSTVQVDDWLSWADPSAFVQWVLHPDVIIESAEGGVCRLRRGAARLRLVADGAVWQVVRQVYSEQFGHVGETHVLRCPAATGKLRTRIEA